MRAADPAMSQPVDSIYETATVVSDAWSWLLLRDAIFHRVERFNDFQRSLAIPLDTLSTRLDQLVRGELLLRQEGRSRQDVRYQLTPRGEDFFTCLVAALRWGDQFCSAQGETRLTAIHRGCGAPFRATLRCSACWAPVEARDVTVDSLSRASSELITRKRQRSPNLQLLERGGPCSVARTLVVIGDRWSSLVVREAFLGTRRFGDFQRRLGIAPNILSNRLSRLVDLGILKAAPYQVKPPRSEYRLTPRGLALYPVPLSLLAWGDRWLAGGEGGIRLTHRPCGASLDLALSCENCAEEVARTDVEIDRSDG